MFSRSRYVVIDDNADELRVLVEALHQIGAPCRGILWNPEAGLVGGALAGVRVLFLDLHLAGPAIAGSRADYAIIAGMLDDAIDPPFGPYILVLWTSHAEECEGFTEYIERSLAPNKKPLIILALDKNRYLSPGGPDGEGLRRDIEAAVAGDPRLQALLQWEHDVLAAAGATLAQLTELILPEDRIPARFSESLDRILSALAVAAVGKANATTDPRAAVSGALAPILADRIVNQATAAASRPIWAAAVTHASDPATFSPLQVARMNAMLHIVPATAEEMRPTSWGAVVVFPNLNDDGMRARTGLTAGDLKASVFQIESKPDRARCRLVLVRIGAGCDYAQGRTGPIPYVIGLVRPQSAGRADRPRLGGETTTPMLALPQDEEPIELIVNARFTITVADGLLDGAEVLFRVREPLLMQIAAAAASHSTRPGVIEFRA